MMEISIIGEITPETEKQFEQLETPVTVRINSHGGDMNAALGIYNRLKDLEDVTILIDGVACSAATIIACAGHCRMAANGLYMIHSPLIGLYGYYNARELEMDLKALNAFEQSLIKTYSEKTWLPEERVAELLRSETWLNAEDAKGKGFVDAITGDYARAEEDLTAQTVKVNDVVFNLNEFTNKAPLRAMAAAVKPAFALTEAEQRGLVNKFFGLFNSGVSDRERHLTAEIKRLRGEVLKAQAELGEARTNIKNTEAMYLALLDARASGADKVRGSLSDVEDKKAAAVDRLVYYANGGK